MASEVWSTYLFEYQHAGATWTFEVRATSDADARERVGKMAGADYLGVLQMKVPVELGVFAKLICRWKNRG